MAPPMPVLSSPWKPQGNCARDLESGYGSDTERSEKGTFSPQVSPRSQCSSGWTSVNRPASSTSPHTTYSSGLDSPACVSAPLQLQLTTSVPDVYYDGRLRIKRTHSEVAHSGCGVETVDRPHTAGPVERSCWAKPEDRRTLEAAEVLMSMGVVTRNTAALPVTKRSRRGSRY
jgi:hypothetical protein